MKGPLLRYTVFSLDDSDGNNGNRSKKEATTAKTRINNRFGVLVVIVHYLIVDKVSLEIVLEELENAYEKIGKGEEISFAQKASSLKEWVAHLMEYAQEMRECKLSKREERYNNWINFHLRANKTSISMTPLDNPNDLLKNDQNDTSLHSWQTIPMKLKKEETSCLLYEVCKLYHAQMQEVLLTGLFIAWVRWRGESMLVINFEGHGRETIGLESIDDTDEGDDNPISILDITNTVGCFVNKIPVYLMEGDTRKGNVVMIDKSRRQQSDDDSDVMDNNSNIVIEVGQTLKSIKEQVRSSLSSKDATYQKMKYLMIPPMNDSELEEYELLNDIYLMSEEITFKYIGQIWEKEKDDEAVVGEWDERREDILLLSSSRKVVERERRKRRE